MGEALVPKVKAVGCTITVIICFALFIIAFWFWMDYIIAAMFGALALYGVGLLVGVLYKCFLEIFKQEAQDRLPVRSEAE